MCHLHRLWFIGEMKGIYSTQKVSAPRILPRISPEEVALPLIIIYFIYMWFFSCHCHRAPFHGQLEMVLSSVGQTSLVFLAHLVLVFVKIHNSPPCFFLFLHEAMVPCAGSFKISDCVHIISASSDLYCSSQWKPFYHVSLISALSTLTKH